MIVYRDAQHLFGVRLTDDVEVEQGSNVRWAWH
jgi:hypothetical protein